MSYTEWYALHEEDCIRDYLDLPDTLRDEITIDDLASQKYESEGAYCAR